MKTITLQDIWHAYTGKVITWDAALWARDNLAYLNRPMHLLGSSVKVEKGSDKRDTYILYLQPAGKVAAKTLCAGAESAGCKGPCLIASGQLGMSTGQRAATKRTILLLLRRDAFEAQLSNEIAKAEKRALKSGIPALFRLNGTSDIDWAEFISRHPMSKFYDYTKILSRVRKNTLSNYHLTYSGSMYSAQSRAALGKALARGYNTAVAVNSKLIASDSPALAAVHSTMVDFDKTDLRPLDDVGSVGVLKRKGSNKAARARENANTDSFFITSANAQSFITLWREAIA